MAGLPGTAGFEWWQSASHVRQRCLDARVQRVPQAGFELDLPDKARNVAMTSDASIQRSCSRIMPPRAPPPLQANVNPRRPKINAPCDGHPGCTKRRGEYLGSQSTSELDSGWQATRFVQHTKSGSSLN